MKNIMQKIKHNKHSILLIMMFFFVLLLPLGTFFIGNDVENIENKTLQEKPKFNISTWQEYPQLYESYYNDTIPYKKTFVNAYNRFVWNLFDESPADYVIKGKDGWLFYNSKYKNDGDVLGDYRGTASFSTNEMTTIVDRMLSLQQLCKEIDAEFYVLVAPNKMEIYGDDYLPNAYKKTNSNKTRVDIVVENLRESGVKVVYPKNSLIEQKNNTQLYYKLDTHWNYYGAYVAYSEFMNSYNNAMDVTVDSIVEHPMEHGDLANMIQMKGLKDTQYILNYKPGITVQVVLDQAASDDEVAKRRSVSSCTTNQKLLMYRDSFASMMIPYLDKTFSESFYIWSRSVDESIILEEQPDVVIFEIVERYVSNLPYVQWNVN